MFPINYWLNQLQVKLAGRGDKQNFQALVAYMFPINYCLIQLQVKLAGLGEAELPGLSVMLHKIHHAEFCGNSYLMTCMLILFFNDLRN